MGKDSPARSTNDPVQGSFCRVGAALSHVLENEGKQIFGFHLSPEALEQLDKVMRQYLQMHVGLDLKSRRFAADICF